MDDKYSSAETSPGPDSESRDYSAPLGTLESGRLAFTSGAQYLELTADPSMPYLYRARFRRDKPHIYLEGSTVTVKFRRFPFFDVLGNSHRVPAEITLNASIPWEIEFHKGVSHVDADLSPLQLRSLDILGGASQFRLKLSRPSGHAFIYVSGGISQGTFHVPPAAGIRVQISGGSTHLDFEGQRFGAIGGETSLESSDFGSATSRYEICIAGGASHLTIVKE